MQQVGICITCRQEVQRVSLLFPILAKGPHQHHPLSWPSPSVLATHSHRSVMWFQGCGRGPLPIFPPNLRDTLRSWLVHGCLSQFNNSAPFSSQPKYHVVAVPLYFLEPLALSAARSCFDPHINSRKQLCAAAIYMDSPTTPWRRGHTWQLMWPSRHRTHHTHRETPLPILPSSINTCLRAYNKPGRLRARENDDSALCRHLKWEVGMILHHAWSNEQEHLWRER